MTAVPAEQHSVKSAFRNVAIVYREPSARRRLSTVASELAPDPAAWHDIGDVASSGRARAQDIARRAEECDADLVVMTVDDARPAARRILARGSAVLVVPPAWRPGAGLTRIAVGYDGSEPADAAVEATRALVAVRDGSAFRVEIVHVDDSASAATEVDVDVVDSRRTAVIEWWLAGVGERIPASVERHAPHRRSRQRARGALTRRRPGRRGHPWPWQPATDRGRKRLHGTRRRDTVSGTHRPAVAPMPI